MIRNPISFYYLEKHKYKDDVFNTNNLHQYDPYYEKNETLYIDIDWWNNNLTSFIRNLIKEKISEDRIVFTHITIPHNLGTGLDGKLSKIVYFAYLDGFDYNIWYHPNIQNGPKNVEIIEINENMKKNLADITHLRLTSGNVSEELNSTLDDLRNNIKQSMKNIEGCVFARLSGTSGKNEIALRPLLNSEDVIQFMTRNKLFLKQEYTDDKKHVALILMPWNDDMETRYEFRIFVVNGKLTAVSQQHWHRLYQYSQDELDLIEGALSDLKFISDLPYDTFVGDVWIDINVDTKTSGCKLIECNPFGAHCGAGSSLFEWTKDFDQLYGKKDTIELRYLSILLYV